MYQALYEPIPDIDGYFERLGISGPIHRDTPWLDALILAHQMSIPFENLDVFEGLAPINLRIGALYQKIITGRRGGYCFELNALFHALLRDCGFRAWPCICRIVRGKDFTPPVLHRGTIIEMDGRLFFGDVGYGGPMPPGVLPVEDGSRRYLVDTAFRLNFKGGSWWALIRETAEGPEPILEFSTNPVDPVDFIALNYYCENHPQSIFRQLRMVNRRTPGGSCAITGDIFTQWTPEGKETYSVASPAVRFDTLEQAFGIPRASLNRS
ncbi:arylamine N-acetyltransferase family protein [Eubacterium barkeri]|uniref:N-hydroxyarylamine O-acetyltransferase n=1 Tax=Eubacterium barkeri TaxID=1528 RepID=A0A1H3D9U0_EUBBA|nr:arylamine N-acetyltransferase [Eubacterium barkeri]SDX63282.1 N-hydroxyarylamine O-acetyltransferase [Eubacterium barkeri]